MIFVTVGSQRPFDRLIRAVDLWAGLHARSDVFAQVLNSKYCPKHLEFTDFIDPFAFNRRIERASVVVAHAGMGSIILALEFGKPIVVMPRRVQFREAHNDHQVAVARRFEAPGRVIVARDENQLTRVLDHAITLGEFARIDTQASPRLLATIRAFLDPYSLGDDVSERVGQPQPAIKNTDREKHRDKVEDIRLMSEFTPNVLQCNRVGNVVAASMPRRSNPPISDTAPGP